MPPIRENKRYSAENSKSSQCDHAADKSKKTNGNWETSLESTDPTNTSEQPHRLARDDIGTERLKEAKHPVKFNEQKEVEADYSDRCDLKGLIHKDVDTYFEKTDKQELKTEKVNIDDSYYTANYVLS